MVIVLVIFYISIIVSLIIGMLLQKPNCGFTNLNTSLTLEKKFKDPVFKFTAILSVLFLLVSVFLGGYLGYKKMTESTPVVEDIFRHDIPK